MIVRYGSTRFDDDRNTVKIDHFILHQNFNLELFSNDIALIILKEQISSTSIEYINFSMFAPKVGRTGTMYGHGLISGEDNTSVSNDLLKLEMTVLSRKKCKQFLGSLGNYKISGKLCTQSPNSNPCNVRFCFSKKIRF